MSTLGRLVAVAVLEAGEFEQGTKKVADAAKNLEKRVDVSMASIAKGAGVAAGFLAASFAASATAAINSLDEINKLSERTGIASDVLQGLSYAAKLADVSSEGLANGLKKLAVSAGEASSGSKELTAVYESFGITSAQLKSLKPDELFSKLADAVNSTTDSTEKSASLAKILGKNFQELVPLLNGGSEGLRKMREEAEQFGLVTGPAAVKQAAEFKDNLDRLKASSLGAAQSLVADLLPTVLDLTNRFIEGRKAFGSYYASFVTMAYDFGTYGENVASTSKKIAGLNAELADLQARQATAPQVQLSAYAREISFINAALAEQGKKLKYYQSLQSADALKGAGDIQETNPNVRRSLTGKGTYEPPAKAAETKKVRDDYIGFLKEINDYNNKILASEQALSPAQQFAAKVLDQLVVKSKNLTAAQKIEITQALERSIIWEATALQRSKQLEQDNKQLEATSKRIVALDDEKERLLDSNNALSAQIEEIGLTVTQLITLRDARMAATIAQQEQTLAIAEGEGGDERELRRMRERIDLLKDQRRLTTGRADAEQANEEYKKIQERNQQSLDDLKAGLSDVFYQAMLGNGSAAVDKLSDYLKRTFEKEVFEIVFKPNVDVLAKALNDFLSQLGSSSDSGGGGWGSLLKSLFSSGSGGGADAGAASQAFASGGVVNTPTLFKFARGGSLYNGLMGEAGPEAIMPLQRGRNGKLGVTVNGSSGGTPSITNHNVYHIDSRSDRASIIDMIERGQQATLASVNDLYSRRSPRMALQR